ncbi:hypothetical protein J2S06_001084 [Bacillus alveayuensis]|uniref:Uncharacterized protein n=1 Tax=Aeribacillus alveayuensis TaxID=279215 RepID=A0ABT9VM16_9BACI|nr:hypothetical protein [Bacillus alveayuensis]
MMSHEAIRQLVLEAEALWTGAVCGGRWTVCLSPREGKTGQGRQNPDRSRRVEAQRLPDRIRESAPLRS